VSNPDRLTGLDSAFLHLEERSGAHMHVASVMVFEGRAPTYEELIEHIEARLHLVPRYRQRLAFVPFGQGRPVWVDDPHFNVRYHLRHTALPRPGDETELKQLAGRLFSQRLDRSKPLWEIWLVDEMAGGRFALIAKTHHALVDGISGVDITTVLFDLEPEPAGVARPVAWSARPLPGQAKLLGEALLEQATVPGEMVRAARARLRRPKRALRRIAQLVVEVGQTTLPGVSAPAPQSPFNVEITPHRRYTWVDAEIERFKAIKDALGGTLNDVVLAAVSLALGYHMRAQGIDTEGLVLKAMVPVSVRAKADRYARPPAHPPALGNRVAAMWAPLPVGVTDARECLEQIRLQMDELKRSGQAVGAQALTNLAGFAPPTILSQAARLQARQRLFNLVITNVPGPQFPLFLLGRHMIRLYPVVPLARRQALGVAVMSYDGKLGFGLIADYDAIPELEKIAHELRRAIEALSAAAGVRGHRAARNPRAKTTRSTRATGRARAESSSAGKART
jgi:diacylglycerol O-acyltransferase / wax synthase